MPTVCRICQEGWCEALFRRAIPGQAFDMTEENEKLTFNKKFCARVKMVRERKKWSIRYTAERLHIQEDAMATYEFRTPMPPYLIPNFAAIMGVTISFLLTGYEEN